MVYSTYFEHPSVHPNEDLYMQFCGIFLCFRISSLVDVKLCLIMSSFH